MDTAKTKDGQLEAGDLGSVFTGVRWNATAKYAAQVLFLAVQLILARLIAPEYFGLIAMASVVTGFAERFKDLGLSSALVQRTEVTERLVSSVFYAQVALGGALAALTMASSPLVSWLYQDSRVGLVVCALSVTMVLASFESVPSALLTRQLQFRTLALGELAGAVTTAACSIGLAIAGFQVWALVGGTLAGNATRVVLINLMFRWAPQERFSWLELRKVVRFGAHLTGFGVFNYFARNADNLIIGMWLGPVALGWYSVAYKLMLLPRNSVSQVLSQVLFPKFSRISDDNQQLARAYLRSCGGIALLTFPMMSGLAAVAQPLVEFLGEQWGPVESLIYWLAPVGAFQSISTTVGPLYLAKGRTNWMFAWGVISGTCFIASFVIGAHWGIFGVAAAFVLVNGLISVPCFRIPFRLVEGLTVRSLLGALAPHAVNALLMAVAVYGFRVLLSEFVEQNLLVLGLSVPFGVLVYYLLVLQTQPPALADVSRLVGVDRVRQSVVEVAGS